MNVATMDRPSTSFALESQRMVIEQSAIRGKRGQGC
jgi:hypothetical protein